MTQQLTRRQFSTGLLVAGTGAATVTLTGCPTAAQWEAIVIANIPSILQVISGILIIAGDPSVSAELEANIRQWTEQITADLNLIKTLVLNYQAQANASLLAEIDAVLMDIQTNLTALLQGFHVFNQTLMITISAIVGLAVASIMGLQALIPLPPAASAQRMYVAYGAGENAIKMAFNIIVAPNYPRDVIR